MENKIQKEEFHSTEVKIEEVESDISDGWEFMSKHEAEMESVPHLSVPKMHEQIEKCDSTSDGVGIDSSRQSGQMIFSQQVQEEEHERVQKEMEEKMQENFQHEENERVRREMVEAMQDLNPNDKEKDRLKRELHELRQTVHQNEQEKNKLKRELRELKQTGHQNEQERGRLKRELRELKQTNHENEQEKDRLRRALHELKQVLKTKQENNNRRREFYGLEQTVKPEQEKDSGRREVHGLNQTVRPEQEKDSARRVLYELKQAVHQNAKEKEIDRIRKLEHHEVNIDSLRRELEIKRDKLDNIRNEIKTNMMRRKQALRETNLDALQNEQGSYRDKRKMDEVMQNKESAFRVAESSETQIHAIEGESSAKEIDESKKVLTHQFNEAFRQLFRVNQPAKAVIQATKTDKLEEEEKKYVELVSEQVKLFQKEGIEFASSDDESKE